MSTLRDKRSTRTDAAAPLGPERPAEVMIGRLVGIGDDGAPLVDFAGNPVGAPVRAMATARYGEVVPGSSVALMFLGGDRARPLAIGLIAQQEQSCAEAPVTVGRGERLTLAAAREVVLQCGRASIVLTRAGKVLVRGTYLSLRSSGVQRITGASVQIN